MYAMKRLFRFLFPFLFMRNWHEGGYEISRDRLVLFLVAVGFVFIGLTIIVFLQSPVEYTQTI